MSGEKCSFIRIRKAEYERLMRACQRQESLDAFIKAVANKAADAFNALRQRRADAVAARREAAGELMAALSQDLRRMEQAHAQQLQQQSQRLQNRMEGIEQRFSAQRGEYRRLIQEQTQALTQLVNEQRRELEQRISGVSQRLAEKERNEREQALTWTSDTAALLAVIAAEHRSEKFQPGRLDQIRQESVLAQNNFERGLYQAAVAAAQQSYLRAADLRLTLSQMAAEWDLWLEAAQRSAVAALAILDAQQTARFLFETDQGAENIAAEIDFWTNGGLTQLRQTIEAEVQRLADPDSLSLDDLKQSVANTEQRRQECLDLTNQAKESLLASQFRNNIGRTLETALEAAGWAITDAVYEGEDFRQAVHVKLENLSGDEIVTVITPVKTEAQSIENKIEISFFDRSTNDDAFRLARLNAITDLLRQEGIEIDAPTCVSGTEHQPSDRVEKLDFNRVRKLTTCPLPPGDG